VAGIIAGDGSGSGTIKTNPPPGSFEDPDFKGMAPKARLHVLKADDDKVNNHVSDSWLQTESATYHYVQKPKRKYPLISNNSWEYEEESDYTWAAASYDAATRDALPDQPGDQGVIYAWAFVRNGRSLTRSAASYRTHGCSPCHRRPSTRGAGPWAPSP
jgi:hypothetical protein